MKMEMLGGLLLELYLAVDLMVLRCQPIRINLSRHPNLKHKFQGDTRRGKGPESKSADIPHLKPSLMEHRPPFTVQGSLASRI